MALVLRPDLDEERQQSVIGRYRQVIEDHGGNVEELNIWGKRRLAYEINDINEGIYIFVPYTADASANAELDRLLRIDDNVVRYMVVVRPRPNPVKPTSLPEAGPGAHGDGPRTGPTPASDRPSPGLPEPRKREPVPAPVPAEASTAGDAPAAAVAESPTEAPAETPAAAPAEVQEPVAEAPASEAPQADDALVAEPEAPQADVEPAQE